MRILKIIKINWITLLSLIFVTDLIPNFYIQKENISRRIKTPTQESIGESYTILEPLGINFIKEIADQPELSNEILKKLKESAGPFARPVNLSTLRIGLILNIIKNSENLMLKDLDITLWFKEHSEELKALYPYVKTEISVEIPIIERISKIFSAQYPDEFNSLETKIINLYKYSLFQNQGLIEVEGKSEEELEQGLEELLAVDFSGSISEKVLESGLVGEGAKEGLFLMKELKNSQGTENIKEENLKLYHHMEENWLMGLGQVKGLPEYELESYAVRYFRDGKYKEQIDSIENAIFGPNPISIEAVKEELREEGIAESILKTESEASLRSRLKDIRINNLISDDVKKFVRDNLRNIQRYVRLIFEWKPIEAGGDTLFDCLTLEEAQEVVRKVIKTYLRGNPDDSFDFYLYSNKDKNRVALYDLSDTRKNIDEAEKELIKRVIGLDKFNEQILSQLDEKTKDKLNKELKKFRKGVLKMLFRKLLIGGSFDFGVGAILDEVQEERRSAQNYPLTISVFNKFYKENIERQPRVKFVLQLDNNGEVIDALETFQYILEKLNPNAVLVVVPKAIPIADDVSHEALMKIFQDDRALGRERNFEFLNRQWGRRFYVVKNGPRIQGVDIKNMSPEVIDAFDKKKHVRDGKGGFKKITYIALGNGNFSTTQWLNVDRYYLLRVKYDSTQTAIGISKEGMPLIFAYVKKGDKVGIGPITNLTQDPFGRGIIPIVALTLYNYAKQHPGIYKEDFLPPLSG